MTWSNALHLNGERNWPLIFGITATILCLSLVAYDPEWSAEEELVGVVLGNIVQISEQPTYWKRVQVKLGNGSAVLARTNVSLGFPHSIGSEVTVTMYTSMILGRTSYRVTQSPSRAR